MAGVVFSANAGMVARNSTAAIVHVIMRFRPFIVILLLLFVVSSQGVRDLCTLIVPDVLEFLIYLHQSGIFKPVGQGHQDQPEEQDQDAEASHSQGQGPATRGPESPVDRERDLKDHGADRHEPQPDQGEQTRRPGHAFGEVQFHPGPGGMKRNGSFQRPRRAELHGEQLV